MFLSPVTTEIVCHFLLFFFAANLGDVFLCFLFFFNCAILEDLKFLEIWSLCRLGKPWAVKVLRVSAERTHSFTSGLMYLVKASNGSQPEGINDSLLLPLQLCSFAFS